MVRPRARLLTALITACAAIAPVTASASEADLPVPYNGAALLTGGFAPDEVPGANDFGCKPSAAHPNPVVLVHGLSATLGTNWQTMSPLLKNNGFCVFGLSYGRQPGLDFVGGLTPMQESSQELAAFVDRVLAATGAKQVDLLGHSEGTVMPRWYLSFLGGAPKVDKYVQMTPLWDGTELGGIGALTSVAQTLGLGDATNQTFAGIGCGSCPQFARGSDYLNKVNAAGPAIPSVTYTEIATQYDELVLPYTSGFLDAPNVTNIKLQDVCPTDYSEHLAVAYSPTVAQLVLNALAPGQARPAQCTTTTPLGTPSPPDVGLGPVPAAAGTPATTTAARHPAKILVRRLGISGGRLDMLASITGRATGTIRGTVEADGRTSPFTIDIARDGKRRAGRFTQIKLDRRIPGLSSGARTGIVTLAYAGNSRVRPDAVRLRAADGRALLRRSASTITSAGDLVVSGTASRNAVGVVRVRMGYTEANGTVRFRTTNATIRRGAARSTWSVRTRLPARARQVGGQLSIQYTGYLPRRIRGEQLAKQVRP